ncbi:MAG: site-2 protease family protein [Theionarchaea archaeon]|nr:site-2 protease family protein [Theionarchaea archaeon]
MEFSQREINDLLISWIVLSGAFALFGRGGIPGLLRRTWDPAQIPIYIVQMLVIVGSAFVLHELSHKYVAQKYGTWAEYQKWDWGLLMGLFISATGFFIFATPGAVMIKSGGWLTPEIEFKITIAGPATNIAVGLFALLIRAAGYFPNFFLFLAMINLFLAVFNLLPIPPMDGLKVLRYNGALWTVTFGLSVVLLIVTYLRI